MLTAVDAEFTPLFPSHRFVVWSALCFPTTEAPTRQTNVVMTITPLIGVPGQRFQVPKDEQVSSKADARLLVAWENI